MKKGQGFVEYTIILCLVAVVVIVAIQLFDGSLEPKKDATNAEVNNQSVVLNINKIFETHACYENGKPMIINFANGVSKDNSFTKKYQYVYFYSVDGNILMFDFEKNNLILIAESIIECIR